MQPLPPPRGCRMEQEAAQLEKQHVHSVYENTAAYLNDLQSKAWPRVRSFLLEQEPGSLVADIGCGTGKYLSVNSQVYNLGCDYCRPLVEIARQRDDEVLVCDNLNLPFRDHCFNAVISIGVIHHFSTAARRVRAVQEMARVLAPGGQLMIYVWAMEQKHRRFEKQDVFVPWNPALCCRQPPEPPHALAGTAAQPAPLRLPRCSCRGGLRPDTERKPARGTDRCLPGACCMNVSDEENRFYSALGRSLRSWFFSRSLDESALRRQTERARSAKNESGWAGSAVPLQQSRHCSLDLGHHGALLREQGLEDDDVFVESLPLKKPQWAPARDALEGVSSNGGHHGAAERGGEGSPFPNGPGQDSGCGCHQDGAAEPVGSRVLQRTSTADSSECALEAAVSVGEQAGAARDTSAFMRYYHVFRDGELCALLRDHVPALRIRSACYDHGNWCVIAEKREAS
ncbi:probable tRNA methyltransferase 9B isoform X2 [Pogoniulus pusillus]|uniref:probable tRNA methyltransferase 9B isoform X2 n=1 Tax=Pogoniulus pusillus TaxID=488313 RepID=UPI0030B96698